MWLYSRAFTLRLPPGFMRPRIASGANERTKRADWAIDLKASAGRRAQSDDGGDGRAEGRTERAPPGGAAEAAQTLLLHQRLLPRGRRGCRLHADPVSKTDGGV